MPHRNDDDLHADSNGSVADRVSASLSRSDPPPRAELIQDMRRATEVLQGEPSEIRPTDTEGRPGGIVHLDPALPLVVLPDIHGRVDLLATVLFSAFPDHGIEISVLSALEEGRVSLLMVGDYVHAEARARERWVSAYDEYLDGFQRHCAMDAEMTESLGVLQTVAILKASFPAVVHCLKGNHENITNEEGQGNHRFYKFADESAMASAYMDLFYPGDAKTWVARFEKELPLLAIGSRYLVSHAEPVRAYDAGEIIRFRENPDVVEGLTWTDNDRAQRGSVTRMLGLFLPDRDENDTFYLGGHRPVVDRYALRCGGRFVQFHNPLRKIVALPPSNRRFDPERDILEL